MADAAADIEERGMAQTAKDLFAGAVGGVAQVLIGQFMVYFFDSRRISSQLYSRSRDSSISRTWKAI